MHSKKWIKVFFFLSSLSVIFVGSINYTIDPLWSFGHTNKFNTKQFYFDERQQKTNYVFFNGLNRYDGILFGSSRSTFINQNDFYAMNIYNYAIDSMYPFEYESYLKLAKESKGEAFKYIIIGADFYNTMKPGERTFEDPQHYIEKTKSYLYRYKMLFSLAALSKSLKTIKFYFMKNIPQYYSRDNIKYRLKVSEAERLERYTKNLKRHTQNFMGSHYQENPEYIKILKRMKRCNPNTKFIIFTSPMTADLLVSVIKNGKKIDEFKKWLHDLVEIFGEVHHFMTINTITKNLENYADDDHYYPHIAKLLANKIAQKKNKNIPEDFGIILNSTNIDAYLHAFEKALLQYKNPLNLSH